jgi:hypothetical protein
LPLGWQHGIVCSRTADAKPAAEDETMTFTDALTESKLIEAARQTAEAAREMVESGEMTRAEADAWANEFMAAVQDRLLGGDR